MTGTLRRLRALPLRSRLALLVAAAVAVAVAAVAAGCWFATKVQLENQMDGSLRNVTVSDTYVQQLFTACTHPDRAVPPPVGGTYTVQLVTVSGSTCTSAEASPIGVTAADIAVAAGVRDDTLHTAATKSGEKMRVYTYTYETRNPLPGLIPGSFAVSVARPMSEINDPLSTLAWVLLAVAGIGGVGAGAAGLWVARTGLRPVDELTEAVEHVARTEDLTVRIPVDGEDEIARLSRSFNSMTASLASSRDRQAQLIADAGHELRTPLTSLRTNVELLARSDDTGRAIPPDDRKALMKSVKAQMTELASLIGDLQELARPDAPAPGPLQVVALHDIADTALERARLRGPELTIRADLTPGTYGPSPPRWSGRWSTSWTTR